MSDDSQCENDLIRSHEMIEEDYIEVSYDDQDFESDVVETEDCIEYKAPVGPNILVSKNQARNAKGRVLSSAISVAPKSVMSNKFAYQSGTSRNGTREQTQALAIRRSTPRSALRSNFRRLQLGFTAGKSSICKDSSGMSVQIRKCTGAIQTSNSALMAYPMFVPNGAVQKRLNSAKHLQIKDLMSKIRQLEHTIEDLKFENRTLKTVQYRQDKVLRKYEGDDADLPKIIQHHRNEVRYLQANLRKVNARTRGYEENLRNLNHKNVRLEQENKKLCVLVEEGNCEERHDMHEQLNAMTFHAQRLEERLQDFSRHIEILEKNHLHQISVQNGKLRRSNKKLFDSNEEIDRLRELIRQKDRIINYLRIRTCRNPDMEPPLLKNMLRECQNESIQNQRKHFGDHNPIASRSQKPIEQVNPGTYRKTQGFVPARRKNEPSKTDETSSVESEDESQSQSHSYTTDGLSFEKDSGSRTGTGTIDEPTSRVSEKQDLSADEDEYITEEEVEDKIEVSQSQSQSHEGGRKLEDREVKELELDPNNIDEYYHFDPINVDELSAYSPRKSLYLDALDSSCNVSSLNSPQAASLIGKNEGDGDTEFAMPPPNDSPSASQCGDVSGDMRTVDPIANMSDKNIIGAAGDATGNLPETIFRKELPQSQTGDKFHSKTETGFVSQRSDIIPSAEKVRLAQLRSIWNKPTAHAVSESSDSQGETDDADDDEIAEKEENELDNKLPIENLKMHFKVPNTQKMNSNELNSFKDVARLNNIFTGLKLHGNTKLKPVELLKIPVTIADSAHSSFLSSMSSPKGLGEINPKMVSARVNEIPSAGMKFGMHHREDQLTHPKIEAYTKIDQQATTINTSKKPMGFAAFDSTLFAQETSPKSILNTPGRVESRSYFGHLPSPPRTGTQHFDFELASIFKKKLPEMKHNTSDLLTTNITGRKADLLKNDLPKRDFHDNLTTTFQRKGQQQQQDQDKTKTRKSNEVWK